jgi:hypothetical protein
MVCSAAVMDSCITVIVVIVILIFLPLLRTCITMFGILAWTLLDTTPSRERVVNANG